MHPLRSVPDKPRRGVIYLRQSTEKEETISDAIQLAACLDYMARNGIVPSGEPIWEQHTGRVWHKRTGVQQAMQRVESGNAELIVVWKFNRLSRLRKHWILAEVAIERLGGTIESATEPADLTTSHGRFSRNLMIDLAELQSDLIGDSWRETHQVRRERGLPASGGRRYGYKHVRVPGETERYEIDPAEAEVLKWMYRSYLNGDGFNKIARTASRQGVPGINGGTWCESTVSALLDSGFGAGVLARYGQHRDGKKYRPSFPDRTWEPGAHTAIIETADWDRYKRDRLARRNEASNYNNPSHELAGLVKCGLCGSGMHFNGTDTLPMLVCGAWKKGLGAKFVGTREHRVRRAVHDWLNEIAADIEGAADRATNVQAGLLRARTDVELAARDVVALDAQLDRATMQNIAGVIPDASYARVRDELLAERQLAVERLAIAERAAEVPAFSPVQLAGGLLQEWDTLPVDRRRDLLKRLIKHVVVLPNGQGKAATVVIEPT